MRDLKHLLFFENLLRQANNELVQQACAEGRHAIAYNCSYIPEVLLDVEVYVTVLLPGFATSVKVNNELCVAETVIVGNVPQTYTYFSTTEDKIEDYADEYIMNNG